jgi:hypothetical protein
MFACCPAGSDLANRPPSWVLEPQANSLVMNNRWRQPLRRARLLWPRPRQQLHGLLDRPMLYRIHARTGGEDVEYLADLSARTMKCYLEGDCGLGNYG